MKVLKTESRETMKDRSGFLAMGLLLGLVVAMTTTLLWLLH